MARTSKGSVYKRGKNYYLLYHINGKRVRQVLINEQGDNITTKDQAQIEADKIIKLINAKNKTEQYKELAEVVATAELKAEALEKQAVIDQEQRDNAIADKKALKIIGAWELYINPDERLAPQCSELNLKNYRGYWRRFSEWLESQPESPVFMRDITPQLAKRFANHLEGIASDNTFNKYKSFLTSFFDCLKPYSRTSENPFNEIARKKKVKAIKKRDLTLAELKTVLTEADGELALLLWIGATTGLRLGDCVTLQWHNINFDSQTITSINRKTGARVIVGVIPILQNILLQMPEEQRQGYLTPNYAERYLNQNTQPHFIAMIQEHFKDCGIQTSLEGTGLGTGKRAVTVVGFHSLRHSFATLCGELGTSEAVTMQLLGHSKASMTRYYQHQTEQGAKSVAQSLNNVFGGLLGETIEAPPIDERSQLRAIIDTLPIDQVKDLLTQLQNDR